MSSGSIGEPELTKKLGSVVTLVGATSASDPSLLWGDRNLYGAGNPREDDRDRRNDSVMSMVPARQLHLFKVSASTVRSNGATEYQLHCAVVNTIRRWILDLAGRDLHPHSERREARPGSVARLKGTGRLPSAAFPT